MYFQLINDISSDYTKIIKNTDTSSNKPMPGNVYFLEREGILSIPEDSTDCRYPYGFNGLNFWAHSSGYMNCNDGLFSVFPKAAEGQEPKIAFFTGKKGAENNYEVISLLSVPSIRTPGGLSAKRYTVFAKACVYYITEINDIRFSVRVFPDKENTLHFTIGIENLSSTPEELFVSSFLNPFLRNDLYEGFENRWFREVRFLPSEPDANDLGSFMIKTNEDLSRTESVSNIGAVLRHIAFYGDSRLLEHQETTSRNEYTGGIMNNLNCPKALYKGNLPVKKNPCAFTELGVAADILRLEIGANSSVRYDIELKYKSKCANEKEALFLFDKPIDIEAKDRLLKALEDEENLSLEGLTAQASGKSTGPIESVMFNSFFYHLKRQVRFCSTIKGYIYLSPWSLIGIRDVFQALEAFIYWDPAGARDKMLEALNFVLVDGRCPRQYTLPAKKGATALMDLRPFIDQGSWVISTISKYLKLTGDMEFLNEICSYYRANEDKGIGEDSGISDRVLDHLVKIMDYLLNNRDFKYTGLIRALYGDWNDALDGLGVTNEPGEAYGSGVSVMATLHVNQNLTEMINILEKAEKNLHLNENYSKKINQYMEDKDELEKSIHKFAVVEGEHQEKRIIHGWGDKRSYFVGSFCDPDGESRYSLTSNAFWILSGMHEKNPYMERSILEAFERLDSKYGFKTFEPYFAPDCPGVGRIPKLPRGTAENGAVYIHASTFAVMALFKIGMAREAWNQIFKLLPVTHDRVSCSPYIMPNSYGDNSVLNIDGESMNDWQTGSSNVMLKIFVRYVFGIEPEYDYLSIQPANYCPFKEFKVNIKIRSCLIKLNYKDNGSKERRFFINGKINEGKYSQAMGINTLLIPWESLNEPVCDILVED